MVADLMCEPAEYDVVILGGAFSGAAAAILLRREAPALRVLVVERAEAFDAKVGEATTEMSGMFLTRRLRLWRHLLAEHLPKEGLRYWSANERVTGHADASEAGPVLRSTVPSFLLRRDVLDEHLLATAVEEGAELRRPARAVEVRLGAAAGGGVLGEPGEPGTRRGPYRPSDPGAPCEPGDPGNSGNHAAGLHEVTFEQAGRRETVRCRWLLDATGRATFLGKRLGLIARNHDHPTAAIWCRWEGVRDLDDFAARGALASGNVGSRRLATNHYIGHGYWVWFIALGNGDTSIGVVFDRRVVSLGESKDRALAYRAFLQAIPAAAELLAGARMRDEDLRFHSHLAYVTRQYMGTGWALLGDAAAFIDPYYSPGLDHAAFSVEATVELIAAQHRGELAGDALAARIAEHNRTFVRSYHRFFEAAYRDKYLYMGEHDLTAAAFLLDTAHYYIFVVVPAYRYFRRFHWMPVLGPRPAFFSYHLMRLYNRRFKQLALARRRAGEGGRRNHGRRIKAFFDLDLAPFHMAARGLELWAAAELDGARLACKRLLAGRRAAEEPCREGTAAAPSAGAAAPSARTEVAR
jgi:flavin-dependent dehydrogenase